MITKNKNPKVNYLGRIIALPLTMLIFTAFTIKVKTVIDNKNNSEISNSTANNSPKETSLLNRITNIFTNNDKVKSSNENEVGVLEKTITVVIDAGHGGEDAGAQTEDGTTLEKDLCLALLKKIKALNKNDKIKLIFTREDDSYNTVKEKAAFAAAQNADLFISIHVDATDAKSAKSTTGLRVFVSNDDIENSTKSKLLATVIIDFFKTNYELPIKPYPVQRKNGIWVIKANNIPSILIEAGYITNPKDLAYLKSDEGQEAFAQNILNGIVSYRAVNYFKNNNLQTKLVDSPPSISANAVMVGRTKDSSKFRTLSSLKLEVSDKADWAKNGIVIINEKRYDFESLNNKIIKAKYCKIYTKGTPEMVIKYGENAKKGIWFFEDATIENSDKVGLNIVADSVYFTDASQKPKNKNNKIYNKEIDYSKALIIIDHVIKDEKAMKAMNPEDIKTINVLKDKSALALYGEKGRNGVLEITTKYPVINENIKTVINGEDPKLSVGNITKSRVSADEFVKQTEINVSDGYKFYSATVYFTGTNFPKVQVANLNGSDFTKAKDFLTLCKAGTSITFVNVKVLGPSGMMAIDDKSFTLY